ncbi:MAG: hypothetical protein AAF197_11020 [Pseudomonadota bacterium]
MNLDRLRAAEAHFLSQYPDGFADEGMQKVAKRHNMNKLVEFAQASFAPEQYSNVEVGIANMVKTVSRSSMVSFFEKPKFKDLIARLDADQKAFLFDSLLEFLHGDQQAGFEGMVDILKTEKLAKWSLLTIIPTYYAPSTEVFIKPTTAKGIIAALEIEDLIYKPQPTWHFYTGYRNLITELKDKVVPSLSPSNAAFTGFLMMSLLSS